MERLYDDSLCLWAEEEAPRGSTNAAAVRSPPSRPSLSPAEGEDEGEGDGNPDDSEVDANEVNSQRGSPTATTSPTSPESDRTVPSKALVTSTVALSDWTRHSRSYCLTASPGRTNHSTISPSLRPSPVCRWDGGRGERHGVGCGGASSPGHLSPPTAPRTYLCQALDERGPQPSLLLLTSFAGLSSCETGGVAWRQTSSRVSPRPQRFPLTCSPLSTCGPHREEPSPSQLATGEQNTTATRDDHGTITIIQ